MRLPIRTRLTLASAGLVAAVVAALAVFVYVRARADLLDAVDAGLRSRADAALAAPGGPSIPPAEPGALVEPDEAFAQLLGADGEVLGSTRGLTAGPLLPAAVTDGIRSSRLVETTVVTAEEPVPARLLAVPLDDGRVLLVGASVEDQHEALERLALTLVVAGPVAVGLVVIVVWLIVGAALRPVESMRAEAERISASAPGRRLPVSPTGDELARLGGTLNEMLARLEEALERERRFVDDASHELRTPLATLRAELDLALRRSRTAEELVAALRSASGETDRLVRLSEDLLVLARADRGRLPVRREPVEVARLLAAAAEPFSRRAAEGGVSLELRSPDDLRADVDELRLRQALGNLLDNALRHTPRGGRVTVEAIRRDGALRLEVSDTGEGFPPGSVPGVFEAFARPDAARARHDGGAGLGLTIVRAVAEAHGGSVEAGDGPRGGAMVVVTIPG
jgi:heavy metal sensor kinase